MGFWDLAFRYLVFLVPLSAVYFLGLRFRPAWSKLLGLVFTGGNLVFAGSVIYLGVHGGGMGFLRAFLYVVGGMFAVLVPVLTAAVMLVARRGRTASDTRSQDPIQ